MSSDNGWSGEGLDSGFYDPAGNIVPDSTGIILHERVPDPGPQNQIMRQTAVQSGNIIAADVSLHDHEGNPYTSVNPLPVAATINVAQAQNPFIFNVSAPLKDTEYSFSFPANTVKYQFKARNEAKLQASFIENGSGTVFWTIFPGNIEEEDSVVMNSKTVYFRSSKPDTVVEFLVWTI